MQEALSRVMGIRKFFSGRMMLFKALYITLLPYFVPIDKRLKALRNKHKGERCFVVANGPSLRVEDLDTLHARGETCFGVNFIYRLMDKTPWRPDYLLIVDGVLYRGENKDKLDALSPEDVPCLLYSKYYLPKLDREGIPFSYVPVQEVLAGAKSKFWRGVSEKCTCRFSRNAARYVYGASSCVHSVLQMAYYMGFSEVYLLGADCGGTKERSHSAALEMNTTEYNNTILQNMIDDYAEMKRDMERRHLPMKIFNATRGGFLEVFPRVDFDSLFAEGGKAHGEG